jgi:CBS domain-containing protein
MPRTVRDVMTAKLTYARQDTPYKELVRLLAERGVSGMPVVDDQHRVVGVVSEADLLVKQAKPANHFQRYYLERKRDRLQRAKAEGAAAAELMSYPAVTVGPEASVAQAARLLRKHLVKRLPVVDAEGRLVGIVSRADVLKVYLRPDSELRDEDPAPGHPPGAADGPRAVRRRRPRRRGGAAGQLRAAQPDPDRGPGGARRGGRRAGRGPPGLRRRRPHLDAVLPQPPPAVSPDQHRTGRGATAGRPDPWGRGAAGRPGPKVRRASEVALRDGTRIGVRPILPEDKDRLRGGFARLSPRSRYRRFLTAVDHLSDEQVRYLTEVDYADHMAWVALDPSAPTQPGVGVARYVRLPEEPTVAEAAVTVLDAYQGKGVRTILQVALAGSALEHGIRSFRGYVLAENVWVPETRSWVLSCEFVGGATRPR